MKENTVQIVSYLLGELSEAELETLEERIFSDDQFAELLRSVEKDLIDDYLRNEMDSDLRRRFEQKFLISESRREKLSIAAVLQKELFAKTESVTPVVVVAVEATFWQNLVEYFRGPGLAWAGGLAAILLFALFGGWMLLRSTPNPPDIVRDDSNRNFETPNPRLSPEVTPTVGKVENSNRPTTDTNKPEPSSTLKKADPVNTAKPEKRNTDQPERPRVFVATLIPILRSDFVPTLRIPKNVVSVQLNVVHDNQRPFVKYGLELRNQDGDLIYNRTIPVNGKTLTRGITLTLPGARLKPDSYELTLKGIDSSNNSQPLKYYNFIVEYQ